MSAANRKRRREPRGQALVEMALGTLVFVSLFLLGIHFAEVGFLSLKVTEAANSALWDMTSVKSHDTYTQDFGLYKPKLASTANQTENRYKDWRGTTANGGGSTITQVVTRGSALNVACTEGGGALLSGPGGGLRFQLGANMRNAFAPPAPGAGIGESGARCTASAQLVNIRMDKQFRVELFQADQLDQHHALIHVCAAGRANGNSCPQAYSMLLDDWGFSGEAERRECHLAKEGGTGCSNQGFYDMVKRVYGNQGPGAASQLATLAAGFSPIDEGHFYLSFRGRESDYKETLPVHAPATPDWETSSAPNIGMPERNRCWLGHACPP